MGHARVVLGGLIVDPIQTDMFYFEPKPARINPIAYDW